MGASKEEHPYARFINFSFLINGTIKTCMIHYKGLKQGTIVGREVEFQHEKKNG